MGGVGISLIPFLSIQSPLNWSQQTKLICGRLPAKPFTHTQAISIVYLEHFSCGEVLN